MNKLDGNEHWKTKMIMTEHVEQFEGQQRDAGISGWTGGFLVYPEIFW